MAKKEVSAIYLLESGRDNTYPSFQTAYSTIEKATEAMGSYMGNQPGWRFSFDPYNIDGKLSACNTNNPHFMLTVKRINPKNTESRDALSIQFMPVCGD